jgi:hypothetical protein
MNFEEFMNKYGYKFDKVNLHRSYWFREENEKPIIGCSIEWVTGGITGGSCWGGENVRSRSGELEPNFDGLDRILEEICPNITFLQYKRICQDIVKEDDYTQNEYYGNCTEYKIKYFSAEDLFKTLKDCDII